MDNNAKNFILLACVAMQEGNAEEAAQLFVHANKMNDVKDFLTEGLDRNVEAQTLVESLSTSVDQLNSVSSEFTVALEEAFGNKRIVSNSGSDEDDGDGDDLDLDVLDYEEDEEDEEVLESKSSASLFRFKN